MNTLNASFLHCNSCFQLPNRSTLYYILSCNHLLCWECIEAKVAIGSVHECPLCKRAVSYKRLNSNIEPNLKDCFLPNIWTILNFPIQALSFQWNQINSLNTHIKTLINTSKHKVVTPIFSQEIKRILEAYEKLHAYRIKLDQAIQIRANKSSQSATTHTQSSSNSFISKTPDAFFRNPNRHVISNQRGESAVASNSTQRKHIRASENTPSLHQKRLDMRLQRNHSTSRFSSAKSFPTANVKLVSKQNCHLGSSSRSRPTQMSEVAGHSRSKL